MDQPLASMQSSLQDALDDLLSPRSSTESKTRALETLERHLALACVPNEPPEDLANFLALQYTFECNVPARILAWIALSTSKLQILTNKGSMDHEREVEASGLSSQLSLSLSLIQGVVLNHPASKRYLGRKYALEVLLDLLLASRHLSSMPLTPTTNISAPHSSSNHIQGSKMPLPLSSVVLDTLLCVLVDSSPALRAFEGSNGVQAVVKILKRAGTPREVRMKCLEFLYFYLLDETPSSPLLPAAPTPTPTAPTTPLRPPKPFISTTPLYPTSHYGSSTFSFSSTSSGDISSPSSRSASSGSTCSFSSTSSNASSSTTPSTSSSLPSSPKRKSPEKQLPPQTPPNSPPISHRQQQQLQPRSLLMLRKDVDFIPLSPKKVQVARLGVGVVGSRHVRGKSLSRSKSRLGSGMSEGWEDENQNESQSQQEYQVAEKVGEGGGLHVEERSGTREKTRTTEEKKELLGTMLGNVDALVDGVRKAGIWGLG